MDVLNVRNQRDLWLSKDHHNFKKLKNFFKNVFVRVKPSGRKKQIRDLQQFAGEYKFNKDNGPTTVEVRTLHSFPVTRLIWTIYLQRHFSEVYNISIRQPKMFGIATGSKERKVVYPAELCIVEAGQFYRKKVPSELTKSVVDFATKTPQERLHIINNGIGLGHLGGLAAPVSDLGLSATGSIVLITHSRRLSMRHRRLSKTLVYVSCCIVRYHVLV
jgi:eukaryotic translation initiation factor 2C